MADASDIAEEDEFLRFQRPCQVCRHLVGIGNPATTPQRLAGGPLSAVAFELSVLAMMGVVLIPLGLWVFGRIERWAKQTGRLKRTG